jgi:hypothetical protein
MPFGSSSLLVIQVHGSKIAPSEERVANGKILVNQWRNEHSCRDELSHHLVFTKSDEEPGNFGELCHSGHRLLVCRTVSKRLSSRAHHAPFDLSGLAIALTRRATLSGPSKRLDVSRCGGAPAAPPSVVSSWSLVKDVTGRAYDEGSLLVSLLDRQIGREIPEQTQHGGPDGLHHLECLLSSHVEVGFPGGNRLPHIQQRL